jgi:hypothetical protein
VAGASSRTPAFRLHSPAGFLACRLSTGSER